MDGGLVLLLLAGGAFTAWWWLGQARERADDAASQACREVHVQRLDASVVLDSVGLVRRDGALLPVLRYAFEFSVDGVDRRRGLVGLEGTRPAWTRLELPEGALHLDLAASGRPGAS
ncbi:MAG: DUF3301 domain-containing protein [Gammaproteobacteria bacterium]|nr:DUF3301 domain-containing protein [Gammaproteobacteria bacterium]MCP5199432.1 DUF3301 domain-containing protein [Gammaproteobacteria bacterium]